MADLLGRDLIGAAAGVSRGPDPRADAISDFMFYMRYRDDLIAGRALAADRFALDLGGPSLEQADRAVVAALQRLDETFTEASNPPAVTPVKSANAGLQARGAWAWGG